MISSYSFEVEGVTHQMRLTTGAMMRLEDTYDKPVDEILSGLEKKTRLGVIVRIAAQMLNDGQGCDEETAASLCDAMGLEAFGQAVGKAAEKAFEPASGKSEKKNTAGGQK